jgi:hypothetical protein
MHYHDTAMQLAMIRQDDLLRDATRARTARSFRSARSAARRDRRRTA